MPSSPYTKQLGVVCLTAKTFFKKEMKKNVLENQPYKNPKLHNHKTK